MAITPTLMRKSVVSRSANKSDDQSMAVAIDRNASLDRQIGISFDGKSALIAMPATTKKLAAAKLVQQQLLSGN
jgi:hypothetical protein